MWFNTILVGLVFISLSAFSGVPKILVMASGQDSNAKLAENLVTIGENFGAITTLIELEKLKLPLYTPKEEKNLGRFDKKRVKKFQKMVMESDGFFICAPEYNGGLPPVLLNAIAWASKITPGVWNKAFSGKAVAICTLSGGSGRRILKMMRDQFSFAGMEVVPKALKKIERYEFRYHQKKYDEEKRIVMNRLIKRAIK